eukprot:6929592-Lingulodinium_polyedra.AAC.1
MSAQPPNHQSITTSPGKAKQSKPRTMVETPRSAATYVQLPSQVSQPHNAMAGSAAEVSLIMWKIAP